MSRYGRSLVYFATFFLVVTGVLASEVIILGDISYVVPLKTMNWHDALEYCEEKGMRLLTIQSAEENDRLVKYLQSNYGIEATFWTAGNDLSVLRHWVWATTKKPMDYTNWAEGEPNNWNIENERCIELKFGKWNDRSCASEIRFVCQNNLKADLVAARAAPLSSAAKGLWLILAVVLYAAAKNM